MLSTLLLIVAVLATATADNYYYKEHWITVPVDHFSFVNTSTFQLRYLVNDSYWEPENGGPIFFYTGNEGDIEMFAQNTGFLWEAAKDFSALVVFAEHRYYGKSLPFGNLSYSSVHYLGYLSSQQALADYVDIVTFLQANLTRSAPVIAFGGSYGGMLSAYFRMKYPHIVAGAIAASAPIFQFPGLTPCGIFNIIVTSDFNINSECVKSIKKSWKEIDNMASTDAGLKNLSTTWHMCKNLTKSDVPTFKKWLQDIYVNLAMLDYPYATNFLAPLPAYPVKAFCKFLPNSSYTGKELLQSLFKAVSVYTNYTGETKCLSVLEDASQKLGDKGWDFQACTEMVMPMCSNGSTTMFEEDEWNFKKYSDECFKKWKVRPQPDLAIKNYGGKDISAASNIVFSNGLLDPWASGGVLQSYSSSLISIIIPEGAHHLDLRGTNPADPPSVRRARQFHKKYIRTWLKDFLNKKMPTKYIL